MRNKNYVLFTNWFVSGLTWSVLLGGLLFPASVTAQEKEPKNIVPSQDPSEKIERLNDRPIDPQVKERVKKLYDKAIERSRSVERTKFPVNEPAQPVEDSIPLSLPELIAISIIIFVMLVFSLESPTGSQRIPKTH